MTPADLARSAIDAINAKRQLQLVLPRKATGRRGMRVFGKNGPIGEVCCENADGHTVVWVDPMEVLAYLAAAGLVSVAAKPEGA